MPARTTAATVQVTAKYDGESLTDTASIEFTPVVNQAATVLSATPTAVDADGTSTATAQIVFKDYAGNPIEVATDKVSLQLDGIAIPVQVSSPGIFTATVPARTIANTVNITATYEGIRISNSATVSFLPVANTVATEVTATPTTVPADGVAAAAVLVAFKDYAGNNIMVDAAKVAILLDGEPTTVTAANAPGMFTATVPARTNAAIVKNNC